MSESTEKFDLYITLPLSDAQEITVGFSNDNIYADQNAIDVIALQEEANRLSIINLDNTKAPITSPTFIGIPKSPTPNRRDNTTQIATTEFITRLGIGANLSETNSYVCNLNVLIEPGEYYYNNTSTNTPAGLGSFGLILVKRESTTHIYQIAFDSSSGNLYIRKSSNGGSTWTTWTNYVGSALKQANGYYKLPSGIILQWGYTLGGSDKNVPYPIVFPNAVFQVYTTIDKASGNINELRTCKVGNTGNVTYFSIYPRYFNGATFTIANESVHYFAIGY